MITMFCVSTGGQAPVYITGVIATYTPVNPFISEILSVWFILSLLLTMIDLFLFNHGVRKYVTGFCFRRWRN